MDKPISVGDLVQVVAPRLMNCPCPHIYGKSLGHIFTVAMILHSGTTCPQCGFQTPPMTMAFDGVNRDDSHWEISRLKRIPPLSELEGVRTEETLKEPA